MNTLTYVDGLAGHRHSLDDITGYDVVRTTWTAGHGHTTIEVMAVIEGSREYGAAVDMAQRLRAEQRQLGVTRGYAYAGNRYGCGCREIAHSTGRRDDVTIVDLEHTLEVPPHLQGLL